MKRLWIRAHAVAEVRALATKIASDTKNPELAIFAVDLFASTQHLIDRDLNAMLVVEIPDDLAAAVMADGYLILAGKVLEEGEEPPYVGSDPGLTEGEMRTETIKLPEPTDGASMTITNTSDRPMTVMAPSAGVIRWPEGVG